MITLKNKTYSSPGEVIKDCLQQAKWTQEDLAQILSLSLKHINEIIKDKRTLSLELISDISVVFGLNSDDEKNFIETYFKFRLEQLEKQQNENNEIEQKAKLYKLLPIGEMIKKGWINKCADFQSLLKEVNKVLGFNAKNIEDLSTQIDEYKSALSLSFRNTDKEVYNPVENNRMAWHRFALQKANQLKNIPDYNKSKLLELFEEIHIYTNKSNGIALFLKKLNEAGVRFVYLSHLSKTYTEGAAFNSDLGPVIALTGRFDRLDNFWFNMSHEIVHIIREHYLSKAVIMDEQSTLSKDNLDPDEIEANEEAFKKLKGEIILEHFKKFFNYIPENEVLSFSKTYEVHPSIVVGILAWHGQASYSILHRFKETAKNNIHDKYKIG
ncbi:helix-turn-helix domain-containing protein [Emticicia sp. C21]|uniref:helix-turn-helix transcriptional regulator n=1 Tax=Emticicia sp. C21 TaxID=2302915 RepID=UPI000E3456FF|nr:helix-turn-helix domain-containing protein [Emticicia sp. C21]RFS15685.1 helix-turn-helix domain-containing protein [Emticicia sp. C21]